MDIEHQAEQQTVLRVEAVVDTTGVMEAIARPHIRHLPHLTPRLEVIALAQLAQEDHGGQKVVQQ